MNFLTEHYINIAFILVTLCIVGYAVFLIYTKQTDKVRKWLLYAVTVAEKDLKSGTGKLKLEYVYDLFGARYSWLKVIMPRATFEELVEDALAEMRRLLETNKAVETLVNSY